MGIVFFYAVMGGMKGITYTQVAQYCVLIFAFLVPAFFISIMMTNNPIPQLGFGGKVAGSEGVYLLDKLDGLNQELGFAASRCSLHHGSLDGGNCGIAACNHTLFHGPQS
jgi:cation/acetate symporter